MASTWKDSLPLAQQTRANYTQILREHSLAELNAIPIGFNNNIIWNIAHIVATTDILFYSLQGLSAKLDPTFIDQFRKGSKPSKFIEQTEVEDIQHMLNTQYDWLEKDVIDGHLSNTLAKPYLTSYGFELCTLNDIIRFNQVHEALHFGVIMSLRKFI